MRSGIFALLLAGILGIGLTACSTGGVQSVLGTGSAEAEEAHAENEDYDYEDDEPVEVPDSIKNLSREDEILLNGELKGGVYINRYFGYKLDVSGNGIIVRDYDGATSSEEILSLSQTYSEGWGGISFSATVDGIDGSISIYICPLDDDEIGLTEEALVQKHIDTIKDFNSFLGDDDEGPALEAVELAGELHPASVSRSESTDGEVVSASFYFPKNEFYYNVYVYGTDIQIEDLTKYFEKLPE